jgi:NADPH:quinone reductase-like Zn-dependent oxidoreductase
VVEVRAIVQDRYGSPDILELRDVDTPVPTAGELLVRVRAASVNAYDWHFMRGDPYLARVTLGLRAPKERIRGRDFAGIVESVGAGVTVFQPGDEVYGEADGAFAEFVCAKDTNTATKPANLTFAQAAAVPLAGNTALMGLRDAGRIQPGQRVLLNGASGGVGTFAVQIAKAFGAEVTAVCSTRNVDQARSLGADRVVDYTREDFAADSRPGGPADGPADGRRYDIVFDLAGNRSLADLRRALTPTGTLVLSGGGQSSGGSLLGPLALTIKSQALSPFVRHRLLMFLAKQSKENLATLRELAESGKVTPVIDRTYPLSDAAEAIRYLEFEHARAKVVITV